ncbi:MAG: hypothetical protein ACXVPE_16385 [Bacteroidia bacterium]
MIYLIDDKKNRQESDYGWNAEKLQKFNSLLIPIYTYEEIKESQKRDAIFSPGNIILFHESFFDNTINNHNKDSVDIRSELNKHATDKKGWVVFFSGSKNSRTLDDRVAHIPVSVLYNNLEAFIEKVSESSIDLRYLLYGGKDPEIEAELLNKLMLGNNQFDETPIISDRRNFLAFAGSRINIPIILEGAIERTFTLEGKYEKEISQSYLNNKVKEWLSDDEVDNIFIPLCFGPSLSDYNGLLFACHIRCTDTVNRLKPIFIYSFVDYSYPIECEYFNILKTKNVFLLDYTRQAFVDSLLKQIEPLTITQLPKEIHKLKLDVPSNYEDSHSIANEWAIYRWALSIGANDTEIEKVTERIDVQLYFKYLQTIYPKTGIKSLNEDQLKITYSGNPKILYIDDEADKGWYEIFCKILYDVNGLCFEHLDEEFNSKSTDEIIKTSIDKVLKDNIDLVILDFRLHSNDFDIQDIKEITGLKLLKKIKELNPGIQVIMFSATNKLLNLQILQKEKVDGFIIKESPEQVIQSKSSNQPLQSLIQILQERLTFVYLKEIWILKQNIEKAFSKNPLTTKYFPKQLKEQLNGIKYQNLLLQELDALFEILCTSNENRFNHSMIMLYKILEYLNEIFYQRTSWEKPSVFYDGSTLNYFDKNSKSWKKPTDSLNYYNKSTKKNEQIKIKVDWLNSTSNKILNLAIRKLNISDSSIMNNLITLSDYRNDFIHSDTSRRGKLKKLEAKDILDWTISIAKIISHI